MGFLVAGDKASVGASEPFCDRALSRMNRRSGALTQALRTVMWAVAQEPFESDDNRSSLHPLFGSSTANFVAQSAKLRLLLNGTQPCPGWGG